MTSFLSISYQVQFLFFSLYEMCISSFYFISLITQNYLLIPTCALLEFEIITGPNELIIIIGDPFVHCYVCNLTALIR